MAIGRRGSPPAFPLLSLRWPSTYRLMGRGSPPAFPLLSSLFDNALIQHRNPGIFLDNRIILKTA